MTNSVSFDRIADKFDATRAYPDEAWKAILDSLTTTLLKGAPILDAGVGTGRFAAPLQQMGFDIVGIDISGRMLEKARGKKVENLLHADLCALPFRDRRFTQTISVHVLHLIKTWKCALREVGRVTTGDFISVAFYRDETSQAEVIRDFYDDVCKELGFEVHHPGVHERELPELLPPDTERPIIELEQPVDVQKLIEDYESRVYSAQWPIPEDIHAQAIQAMKERFEGVGSVMGRERIVLLQWGIKRIREFSKGVEPYRT